MQSDRCCHPRTHVLKCDKCDDCFFCKVCDSYFNRQNGFDLVEYSSEAWLCFAHKQLQSRDSTEQTDS